LDSLLRCASARAGGGLQSLDADVDDVSEASLPQVVAANGGALRELHMRTGRDTALGSAHAEGLARAAPALRVFTVDCAQCDDVDTARRMLRNEAPFGPLRMQTLCTALGEASEADMVAFAADVAAHASLTELSLSYAPLDTPAALDAVVGAALAHPLRCVRLNDCALSPASAPALARLLSSDTLTTLQCYGTRLLDVPAAALLAGALRANATLTSLTLRTVDLWREPAAATALLGALAGHASLRTLSVLANSADGRADEAGAALGALVAANAPALTELDVSLCDLGDDGLRPLLAALRRNTHLRTLDCSENDISEPFARRVLLPAVRANASLRTLHAREEEWYNGWETAHAQARRTRHVAQAERIVNSRAP
jgi:hypothetical protein